MKGYNVVFEGIGGPRSNFPGIRTWTTYESKADFDAFRHNSDDIIVAEGVSRKTCLKLTAQTSAEARARYAINEARQDPIFAQHCVMNGLMAVRHDALSTGDTFKVLHYLDTLAKEAPDLWLMVKL